ncbi:MAG: hypothetical protein JSV79_03520 [Armatimonadota bacterium]|nr:MAG: hypothetical protein JSV79_03520 [Armatimonadota bacterium]
MKVLRWLPVVAGAVLLVRRFGPEMGEVCGCIFDKMPDEFPPKWMYLNIRAIREQNERIIQLLEEQAKGRG